MKGGWIVKYRDVQASKMAYEQMVESVRTIVKLSTKLREAGFPTRIRGATIRKYEVKDVALEGNTVVISTLEGETIRVPLKSINYLPGLEDLEDYTGVLLVEVKWLKPDEVEVRYSFIFPIGLRALENFPEDVETLRVLQRTIKRLERLTTKYPAVREAVEQLKELFRDTIEDIQFALTQGEPVNYWPRVAGKTLGILDSVREKLPPDLPELQEVFQLALEGFNKVAPKVLQEDLNELLVEAREFASEL